MKVVRHSLHQSPPPIRVLLLEYRDDAADGGTLRVAESLANHLDPERVEAHILFAYGGPGPVSARTRAPVHFLGARSFREPASWIRARRVIGEIKPDVLHFVVGLNWVFAATGGLPGKRLLHFHGPTSRSMRLRNRLLVRARRYLTDGFVCITHGARRSAIRAGFADPSRAWTVYNGVDVEALSQLPSKEEARTALKLPPSARLAGQVARIAPSNGGMDLVRLLPLLPKEWHAVFVGDGAFRADLERAANRLGVSQRVHFTGLLGDVRPAYAALDIVAFLAPHQPFCLMLAEAMAAGVPVFGLVGVGHYVEPENPLVTPDNAALLDRANPGSYRPEPAETLACLAKMIAEYGQQPERFAGMIENARGHVRDRFSAPAQAEAMTQVYRQLLGLDGRR